MVSVSDGVINPQGVRVELLKMVPNVLSTCNCLHVALLVYLRLMSITQAFKYKKTFRQHRYKSIVIMWVTSVVINIVPLLMVYYKHEELFLFFRHFILYTFHVFPIIYIVVVYAKLIHAIKTRNRKEAETRMSEVSYAKVNFNNKLSTKMIQGIVVCLIVCYLPYLAWWQYAMTVLRADGARWCPVRERIIVYPSEVNM